jgi:hypothetical protein
MSGDANSFGVILRDSIVSRKSLACAGHFMALLWLVGSDIMSVPMPEAKTGLERLAT